MTLWLGPFVTTSSITTHNGPNPVERGGPVVSYPEIREAGKAVSLPLGQRTNQTRMMINPFSSSNPPSTAEPTNWCCAIQA